MALQITKNELFYQRNNFYENIKVHGLPCKIYSIADNHDEAYDFYNDIKDKEQSFDDVIDSFITYEEVPQIKTLKSLGWYIESEELPVIGYIPILYYNEDNTESNTFLPSIDDKIVLKSNPYDENSSERAFLLKDFKSNGFPSVIYYTVKLVPFRRD